MVGDRTSAAEQSTGSTSGRRPTGDQRHRSCAEGRLPMGGLPCALRAVDDGLQSVQPVVSTRALAAPVRRPGNNRCGRHADHRQHDGQGPSLCRGWKRGALAQAIGRSRGGRTTKIHAVVDCLGRLIAFEITPGQLGDVRVAGSLLAPMPAARLCIADTAYDSNGLRQFLSERGTQPVIPNNPTRKRFHPFEPISTSAAISSSACFVALRTGVASPLATTSWPPTSQPPSQSPSSCGGPD